MSRYETLAELRSAYQDGTLTDEQMILDNDEVFVYSGDDCVFRGHPSFVCEAALDLLGIPWDHA